jgi:hypothetical protein
VSTDTLGHRPDDPTPRVLFVGGCGRSGSTLVDRILGQVPGVSSIGEVVHIWRRGLLGNQLCGCGEPFPDCPFWTKVGAEAFGGWEGVDGRELLALQRRVDRHRFVPLMLAPWVLPSYARDLRRHVEVLAALYRGIASVSGARVIVDSTKHASYAFLLRRVPGLDLRILHLVRDARGVAYSWTKVVEKPEITGRVEHMPRYSPMRMALRWLTTNALFHALRAIGVPSLFVRYESLIERPREQLERIVRFAGVPVGDRDLPITGEHAVHLDPTHSVAGNPMRFTRGEVELRLDEQWRRAMPVWQRATVTAIASPMLAAYRYPLRSS